MYNEGLITVVTTMTLEGLSSYRNIDVDIEEGTESYCEFTILNKGNNSILANKERREAIDELKIWSIEKGFVLEVIVETPKSIRAKILLN